MISANRAVHIAFTKGDKVMKSTVLKTDKICRDTESNFEKCFRHILFHFCFLVFTLFPISSVFAESVKIAAIFAKNGLAAGSNDKYFRGTVLAVREINETGGVLGRDVELIELDNKSTLQGSRQAALEAIRRDVIAVIGAGWSSHSLAMAPLLQEAGIPMITPGSTNPEVTRIGDHIFRTCFTDAFQGRVMARFARKELGAETAFILKNVSSHYSLDLAGFFKDDFSSLGGKVPWEGRYKEKDLDFMEVLKPIRDFRPDVVFLPGYVRDSALILKQAFSMGIDTPFLGGDGWSWSGQMRELAGDILEGNYYCSHWHEDADFGNRGPLETFYKLNDREKRTYFGSLSSYDAVTVLIEAIRTAGGLDRKKIRDALASTRNFQGTLGDITFDENRNPVNRRAVVLKFEGGRSVLVKTVKPDFAD